MALRSYTLPLTASVQRVSDVYLAVVAPPEIASRDSMVAKDIPYRQLILQAFTADAFVGNVNVTAAPIKLAFSTGQLLVLGPFETGPVRLSDLYALGNGSTLMILGVPF